MPDLWLDLKVACRSLLASRSTTVAAVLVLALGTGINVAVLAVAYGILIRPLPYPDPSGVVVIVLRAAEGTDFGVPAAQVEEWQRRLRSVRHVGAYSVGEFTLRGIGEPRVVRTGLVRGAFFEALGAAPARGRFAGREADDWLVVSARLARQLAGERVPVGEAVTIGQGRYAIAAVVPDSFAFPNEEVTTWLPSSTRTAIGFADRPDARSFRLVARLKPGVTVAQAAEDANRVLRELLPPPAAGDANARKFRPRAVVLTLDEVLTGRVRPVLGALAGAALLVLLVACANVASLFVGRAFARSHDVSVRLALGARPWHLVRGVLAESLVIALAASAIGLWVGFGLVRLFVRVAAGVFPRLDAVAIDLPVLVAGGAIAFLVALACGAAPAWHASRTGFAPALRTATSSRPTRRLRSVLTAGQIALSIVLLAGAGLVARTVTRLLDQAKGIDPTNTVSLRLVMSDTTTFTAASRLRFVREVADRVRAMPGVRAAGVGSGLPPRVAPLSMGIRVVSAGRDEFQVLTLMSVTPGYLQALGARLVRGRLFQPADLGGAEPVAILSESAARHLSPRQEATGRPLVFPLPAAVAGRNRRPQVVGVVGDIKYAGLDATSAGSVYVLWPDLPAGVGYLVVKGGGDPSVLAPAVRRVVRDLDPALPVPEVRTLDDEILSSIADRRLRMIPAVAFGLLALVVALVGLSASMTRAVAERRRELAIRGALGSSPGRTLGLIVREGAIVTAAGIAAGVGLAAALARTLAQLLYGVSPHDPATFAAVAAIVGLSAVGVSYLAARRVLRIDPIELLRTE